MCKCKGCNEVGSIVYISSPYRGETNERRAQNVQNAKDYGTYALRSGCTPIIPHVNIAELTDDDNAEDRAFGMAASLRLLQVCSQMWVFGTHVSDGMLAEIREAKRLGIKIRWFTTECKEYTNLTAEHFVQNALDIKNHTLHDNEKISQGSFREYMDRIRQPIGKLMLLTYYGFDIYETKDLAIPYIVGVVCSTGVTQGANSITILNPYTVKPVAEFNCRYIDETTYARLIIELVTKCIPRAIVCIERNSAGSGILDCLLNSQIASRLYYDKAENLQAETQKMYYGVSTERESRNTMLAILAKHISEFKDNFVTRNILTEISELIWKSSGRIDTETELRDGAVMSYLICLYVYYHGNNLNAFGFDPGRDPVENL